IFSTSAIGFQKGSMRTYLKRQLALAAGLLLVLPIAFYIKLHFAPPDPMLNWKRSTLYKLVEWPRYWQIFKALSRDVLRFGESPLELPPILAFYALLLGVDVQQRRRRGTMITICTLGLTLAGYAGVYLTTRYDLAWQLRTSLQRLLLQLWPSTVFLFFL